MQSFKDVDMDGRGRNGAAPGGGGGAKGSRLLDSALGSVTATAKKARPSPYDRRTQDPRDRWQHDKYSEDQGGRNGSGGGHGRYGASSSGFGNPRANYISPKLKLENLHYEVTEMDLRELFSNMGKLAKAPEIIYDRSGRSTGIAYVLFREAEDARAAKEETDGQNAFGQSITVSFEPYDPRKGRRSDGAEGGAGGAHGGKRPIPLAQRVEPRDLLSRLDAAAPAPKAQTRRAPANASSSPASGQPNRNTGSARSARGPSGATARGGRAGTGPKTATDLDAELDAFMKTPATAAMGQSIHAPKPGADGDIEMQ